MCRASGARHHSSIFPSAYALGYFMPHLPALVRGGSLHPDRLKFLVLATTPHSPGW